MDRMKNFLKTSLIGGVAVILPIAILVFIVNWLFNLVTRIIQPLTNLLLAKSDLQEIVANILIVIIILAACFGIGIIVKTKVGKFIHENLEKSSLFS